MLAASSAPHIHAVLTRGLGSDLSVRCRTHPRAGCVAHCRLLGGADEAGVMAAEDECAQASAGFVGGQADQTLFEVAGYGVGVAGAGVPGGGGDDLVGLDSASA